jgi:hypothetical protein
MSAARPKGNFFAVGEVLRMKADNKKEATFRTGMSSKTTSTLLLRGVLPAGLYPGLLGIREKEER